ncbi:V-set and immunoglobulin domain-containing protein 1-like [Erpetoichthys calabaricus]|uniref:V-set and immunoglobulin domain-containing protein 1-like n=1 Tax=Erpetoichthys calabaricus TaxID=27687 RepID=UPI0010A0872B|nr:V-set and immunoglobulin domain-containing protein 1-like [Erpetoichthys calabaricus]
MTPEVLKTVIILSCMIGVLNAMQVSTPSPRINTTAGGNVTLQCNFQTSEPLTNLFIQWQFTDTRLQHNSVYAYINGKGSTPPKYGGRVFASAPNSATINITNMQPSDSGTYVCEVMNVPDIEGTTQASILVSVLAPPSKPYCAAHGTEERGHLITLTCSSNMGLPSPLYTWSKLENGVEKVPNGIMDTSSGSLIISNLSLVEFGIYQCNASNILGSATCTVELTHGEMSGAIVGGIFGAILIAIIIVIVVCVVKSKKMKGKNINENKTAKELNAVPGKDESTRYKSGSSEEAAPMNAAVENQAEPHILEIKSDDETQSLHNSEKAEA